MTATAVIDKPRRSRSLRKMRATLVQASRRWASVITPRTVRKKRLDQAPNYSYVSGMFKRRLGPHPHANGATTPCLKGCPDMFELESGDFAVIGRDITTIAAPALPRDASCGTDERIVVIPRRILIHAKTDIPDVM